jgi:hypothetical protein
MLKDSEQALRNSNAARNITFPTAEGLLGEGGHEEEQPEEDEELGPKPASLCSAPTPKASKRERQMRTVMRPW